MGEKMKKQKQTNQRNQRSKSYLFSQQGFTLIELMTSLALGLVVVALVGGLYANNSDIFRFQRAQGEAQEKARYVLGYLRQNLQQTGYHRDGTTFLADQQFRENEMFSKLVSRDTRIMYRYQKAPDLRNCAGEQIVLSPSEDPLVYVRDTIELLKEGAATDLNSRLVCYPNIADITTATGIFEVAKGVFDLQFQYGVDTSADFVIDKYISHATMADENWLNIHAVSVCVLVASDTKLPLIKKGMAQLFTDCQGVAKSSNDYVDVNGLSPVMTVVRTTIYLPNTPKPTF
jgi:prepilin-type N-terminal cleavage/methylation domain-containing protein